MRETKNNQKKIQIIIATAIILGLFIGTQFFMGEPVMDSAIPETEAEDKENPAIELPVQWEEVESEEEVYQHYEDYFPALKTALDRGLFQEIDQKISIKDHEGEIHLDKIWFSNQGTFIYYSLDLEALENLTSHHHTLGLRRMSMESLEGEPFHHPPSLHHPFSDQLKVYDNKVYMLANAPSFRDDEGYPIETMDETFSINFNVMLPTGAYRTENTTLRLKYDLEDNLLASIPVDETLQVDGNTVQVKEINFDVMSTEFQFTIEEKQVPHVRLDGRFIAGAQDSSFRVYLDEQRGRRAPEGEQEETIYYGHTSPLTEIPEEMELAIVKSSTISDESFTFEVDVSDYNEEWNDDEDSPRQLTKIKRTEPMEVAEVFNTKVYLEKLVYNKNEGAEFTIRYQLTGEGTPEEYLSVEAPSLIHEQEDPWLDTNVRVENEQKKLPDLQGGISMREQDSYSFLVPHSYLRESDHLTITVNDLLHTKEINEKLAINTAN